MLPVLLVIAGWIIKPIMQSQDKKMTLAKTMPILCIAAAALAIGQIMLRQLFCALSLASLSFDAVLMLLIASGTVVILASSSSQNPKFKAGLALLTAGTALNLLAAVLLDATASSTDCAAMPTLFGLP